MKRSLIALCLVLVLLPSVSGEVPSADQDPLARFLFPPEKVLGHAQEIRLEEAQRKAIRNEVLKAQSKFLDSQFDLQSETEKMTLLLQQKPVDEDKVLAQVDRILALEKEIKKTQISLLVRIKNLLTAAQQAKLTELQTAAGR
jgi:Spy/CpxP family protein refolding chaperone